MEHFGGGNWTMIPNIQSHSNPTTPSNQDHLYLQQQQQSQFNQPQFQPHFNQQQQQRFPQQQTPQQQPQQSLASHFDLQHLVENLADVVENGTRDQQTDALVTELNNQFEKCQQLLNSISGTIKAKSTTVEEQKHKLMDTENLLKQRRDLVSSYRDSVEELINSEI
ncbi:mediator of RNA polymerase II transcription subunit 9 [Olea europaea var. sylvestris]|uniref:Mediator of RNA polymerase II transcription subunit 9 n=1 Tax=Olea europaea subsp. europaea TaxID=158383 RepID=A0A8S0UHX2_OLEEU|nr:mediator of RNA polymerase II transcription subunit 9 [Olea europaea var. sylvestris]CAA3017466.1 mediator of RNA polymerase II transcription subunit 9 [Olea europaea subsp. europaea]